MVNLSRLMLHVAKHEASEPTVPASVRAIGEELIAQGREIVEMAEAMGMRGAR